MATKKTNGKRQKKSLRNMTDAMKEKYADLIVSALDTMEGAQWKNPWVQPNQGEPANLYRAKQPYKGVNAFLLQLLGNLSGFNTPYYLTKTQIVNKEGALKYKELRWNLELKMDAEGIPVFKDDGTPRLKRPDWFPVYWFKPIYFDKDGNFVKEEELKEMTDEERDELTRRFTMKDYEVWNIDQTNFREVYPEEYERLCALPKHEYRHTTIDPVLERMLHGEWICPILYGGNSARYNVREKHIRLPEEGRFLSDEHRYATAIHEMAHSTKIEIERWKDDEDEGVVALVSPKKIKEELFAELTAAVVCSMLGVGKLLDEQHLCYVDSWRKAIRSDHDFIPQVIDEVQRGVNFILRKYDEVAKAMEMPLLLAA